MKGPTGKTPKKADLPEKICAACGRPFAWRKKWERSWDEVRFCSERCRRQKARARPEIGTTDRAAPPSGPGGKR